jgi:TolB-like protein/DNA-binding winged helix-turn-helix (wHTH) protein/Tfp pilus assembly protein PilF
MESSANSSRIVSFGSFALNLRAGELHKSGVKVKLQEQPFQVLALLVTHPGEVVTREQLGKELWPAGTFTDFDQGLNSAINKIREALGDSAESPRFVETLARRGYRFIAPVKELHQPHSTLGLPGEASASASWWRKTHYRIAALVLVALFLLAARFARQRFALRADPSGEKVMLAVLPFLNYSGDPGQEYFNDGLTEEMITQLGSADPGRLGVIARTSSMKYKNTQKDVQEIGRELGVDYVLEGSVRRVGDRVRISAQLIQVRDQTHLWAESYERDAHDTLALESDVAIAIAAQVERRLPAPHPLALRASARPVNPEAYDLYLKGRFDWNQRTEEGFTKAIDSFQQAIEKDPNYAQAYAGLADAYSLLGSMANVEIPRKEAMPKARTAALKALEIDETLAEAHTSLAFVLMHYDWDWPGAEKEFQRAIVLNPDYATAHQWHAFNLMVLGRTEDSFAEIHRALELDPLSLIINTDLAELLYCARRYDEAIRQGKKTSEMDPGFALAHAFTGLAYLEMKQFAQAIAEFQEGARVSGNRIDLWSCLAVAYALAGRSPEARTILQQMEKMSTQRFDMPVYLFRVYRALGEEDQAFFWLEKAFQDRDGSLILLAVDPANDSLRSDPRFQNITRRMGLFR